MRLDRMLEKDLKLFKRDSRTVFLIIFTPIIIMAILGQVFSGSSSLESITGVAIAVCNHDKHLELQNIPIFDITYENPDRGCEERVSDRVKRGELRGAIVIPSNFSKNIQLGFGGMITLYVDSSKSQTAIVTTDAMKAYVQELNEQIGVKFIEEAWKNLNRLNLRLKYATERLIVARDTAEGLEVQSQELLGSISQVDTGPIYKAVDILESQLNEVDSLLSVTENVLAVRKNTSELQNNINSSIDEALNSTSGFSDDLKAEITLLKKVQAGLCVNSSALCDEMQKTIDELTNISEDIGLIKTNLEAVAGETKSFLTNETLSAIGEYDNVLEEARNEIAAARMSMIYADNHTGYIRAQVALVDVIRLNMINELEHLQMTLKNYTGEIISLTNELEQTTIVLDEYTSRNPRSIVSAVRLDARQVYGERTYFQFLSPGLISAILMFIMLFIASAAIVSERKKGTMARNFLAPLPIPVFLLQKILYLLILAVIQLILMFLISAFFGVYIPLTLSLLIVVCTVSITFVCLGMFIGAASKTENTALLTSLVVGLPMLFLSGLFFPFEIMPPFMKMIGSNLPLTLSTINLERIIIYHTQIDYSIVWKLVLTSVLLFVLTYILVKRKPMLD